MDETIIDCDHKDNEITFGYVRSLKNGHKNGYDPIPVLTIKNKVTGWDTTILNLPPFMRYNWASKLNAGQVLMLQNDKDGKIECTALTPAKLPTV